MRRDDFSVLCDVHSQHVYLGPLCERNWREYKMPMGRGGGGHGGRGGAEIIGRL